MGSGTHVHPFPPHTPYTHPTQETLKNTAIEVWDGLPPPAQRYLPYIASSGVASFITYKLQRKRVQLEV